MISKLASIHPTAKIATNVTVEDFAVIGADVEIGDNCIIKSHSVIRGPTVIGNNNVIYQFASIGDQPQDLKFGDEISYLEIGDNNTFREYVSVNRGTKHGGSVTRIGNNNLFITHSHVAHDCQIGDYNILGNCTALAGHVELADHIILSANTKVTQFLSIGSYVFSTISTNISKNIPPFVWVSGQPAQALTLNKVGLLRNGFSKQEIAQVRKLHKVFFRMSYKLETALAEIEKITKDNPKLNIFTDFVKQHKDHALGIIRK